jgi:serine phosphatase RsbU (regulator of sigma subunit)
MKTLVLSGDTLKQHLETLQQYLEPEGLQVLYMPQCERFSAQLAKVQPDILIMEGEEMSLEDLSLPARSNQSPSLLSWLNQASKKTLLDNMSLLLVGQPRQMGPATLKHLLEIGLETVMPLSLSTEDLLTQLRLFLSNKQEFWRLRELNQHLSKQNDELYHRNLVTEKELYTTRQLQQSLLPTPLPEEEPVLSMPANMQGHEGLNDYNTYDFKFQKTHLQTPQTKITGIYLPCDALGGDIYDVITFADNSVGVTIADVSGHGVPAGFVTALFKSCFYRTTHTEMSPDKVLFEMNNQLAAMVTTGEYVTAIYARLLNEGRLLEFSGAGHPYPIYYNAATGTIQRLKENGTPLVWIPDMTYNKSEQALAPGDKVLLFTDGVSEINNSSDAMLGEEALEHLFLETIFEEPPLLLDAMIAKISDFTEGCALADDLSMVLIEVT